MAFTPNPQVPYLGPLSNICQNVIIQIAGQPTQYAKWFAINLQCGPNVNPRDDIALHINPRFEGNMSKIVRNSLQAQQWGLEENFGHFPLVAGQPFEILILVDNDHFKLAINGQHYTEFRHRMPIQRINTLSIDGDVQLFSIRVEQPNMQRSASPLPPGSGQVPPPAGMFGIGTGFAPPVGTQPMYTPQYAQQPSHSYATSAPMPVPGHSPSTGYGKGLAGAAVGLVTGAAAAYGASKLMYPGHGGGGMGMMGPGMGMMGPAGMMGMGHHKKMKKLYKHKFHKPKFHKFKFHKFHKPKFHKGWHHKGWGSGSSSSSEESEESEED